MNIDKKEMDTAWANRDKSDKFYKYLYEIATLQVQRKGIRYEEQEDYIQFAIMKCFSHQNSFNLKKGSSYSFFWKQISLAIIYKQRKQARRNNKMSTFYVEQEKILDWAEKQHNEETEGISFYDIVDREEILALKYAFKRYNKAHKQDRLKPDKSSAIKVVKWIEAKEPGFIDNFTTLKPILKNWTQQASIVC